MVNSLVLSMILAGGGALPGSTAEVVAYGTYGGFGGYGGYGGYVRPCLPAPVCCGYPMVYGVYVSPWPCVETVVCEDPLRKELEKTNKRVDAVVKILEKLDERLERLEHAFGGLNKKVETLEKSTDDRLKVLEKKIKSQAKKQKKEIEVLGQKMEEKIKAVETKHDEYKRAQELKALEDKIRIGNEKLEDKILHDKLREGIEGIDNRLKKIETKFMFEHMHEHQHLKPMPPIGPKGPKGPPPIEDLLRQLEERLKKLEGKPATMESTPKMPPADDLLSLPQNKARAGKAMLIVSLPENATLYLQGQATKSTGNVRTYQTPELQPGEKYSYSVRVEMMQEGKLVSLSRQVSFQAGQQVRVAFEQPQDALWTVSAD